MNLIELQKKLLAAARANTPTDRVPFAFEKRVTALLASRIAVQNLNFWISGLWRAAFSCVAIALVCGAFAVFTPTTNNSGNDLSQTLDNTLLASLDQGDQAQ